MHASSQLEHVEIAVRVRPNDNKIFNKLLVNADVVENETKVEERAGSSNFTENNEVELCVSLDKEQNRIRLRDIDQVYCAPHRKSYYPNKLFGPNENNENVFNKLILPKLNSLESEQTTGTEQFLYRNEQVTSQILQKEAYSSHGSLCFLAFGHTSSGKTHSIVGSNEDDGVLTRTVRYLLNKSDNTHIRVAMLEIYIEKVYDLLANGVERRIRRIASSSTTRTTTTHAAYRNKSKISFTQKPNAATRQSVRAVVENLSTITISSLQQWNAVSDFGMHSRHTAFTEHNNRSSRSHALFIIQSLSTNVRVCFVDLAGSECQKNYSTQLDKESISINKSLSRLSTVLRALSSMHKCSGKRREYVNFRDSTLTVLLERYLCGPSRTTFLACVHPSTFFYRETLNTLRYLHHLKQIKTGKLLTVKVHTSKMANTASNNLLHDIKSYEEQHEISPHGMDSENEDENDNKEWSFVFSNEPEEITEITAITHVNKKCQMERDNCVYKEKYSLLEESNVIPEVESKVHLAMINCNDSYLSNNLRMHTIMENIKNSENETKESKLCSKAIMQNEVDLHSAYALSVEFDDMLDKFISPTLQVIGYVVIREKSSSRVCEQTAKDEIKGNHFSYISKADNNDGLSNVNSHVLRKSYDIKSANNTNSEYEVMIENTSFENMCNKNFLNNTSNDVALLPVDNIYTALTMLFFGVETGTLLYSNEYGCLTENECIHQECCYCQGLKYTTENSDHIRSLSNCKYAIADERNYTHSGNESLPIYEEIVESGSFENKKKEIGTSSGGCRGGVDGAFTLTSDMKISNNQELKQRIGKQSTKKRTEIDSNSSINEQLNSATVFLFALFTYDDESLRVVHKKSRETISLTYSKIKESNMNYNNELHTHYISKKRIFPIAIVFTVPRNSSHHTKQYALERLIHLVSLPITTEQQYDDKECSFVGNNVNNKINDATLTTTYKLKNTITINDDNEVTLEKNDACNEIEIEKKSLEETGMNMQSGNALTPDIANVKSNSSVKLNDEYFFIQPSITSAVALKERINTVNDDNEIENDCLNSNIKSSSSHCYNQENDIFANTNKIEQNLHKVSNKEEIIENREEKTCNLVQNESSILYSNENESDAKRVVDNWLSRASEIKNFDSCKKKVSCHQNLANRRKRRECHVRRRKYVSATASTKQKLDNESRLECNGNNNEVKNKNYNDRISNLYEDNNCISNNNDNTNNNNNSNFIDIEHTNVNNNSHIDNLIEKTDNVGSDVDIEKSINENVCCNTTENKLDEQTKLSNKDLQGCCDVNFSTQEYISSSTPSHAPQKTTKVIKHAKKLWTNKKNVMTDTSKENICVENNYNNLIPCSKLYRDTQKKLSDSKDKLRYK